MDIGLVFWILMLIWLVFGFAVWHGVAAAYGIVGNNLFMFVLLLLLGWAAFGPPIHG